MKVRIKFSKHGAMKFIGHLDTQRYFQKLNRRAGLNVAYSEGFSPHQKMSFAMPLSVGLESEGEYLDLELKDAPSVTDWTGDHMTSDDLVEALNSCGSDGIRITDCVRLPDKADNAMASVRAADYLVRFREGYEPGTDISDLVRDFEDSEEYLIKKPVKKASKPRRKKNDDNEGEAYNEIDLKKLVYELRCVEDGIFIKASAGSKDNIKPDLVIRSLYEKAGIELPPFALVITRLELYTDNMVPLLDAGDAF